MEYKGDKIMSRLSRYTPEILLKYPDCINYNQCITKHAIQDTNFTCKNCDTYTKATRIDIFEYVQNTEVHHD